MGIIAECAASECAKHKHLIPQVCRGLKHPCNPSKHHIPILRVRYPFQTIAKHRRRAAHYRNNYTVLQKIPFFISDNLHLRCDHQSI